MELLIYSIFLLGSYSVGYGLIRAGFPLVQKRKLIEKIALGYIGGIILFGLPFLVINYFNLKDTYYFVACIFIYFLLLMVLLLKRTIFNETDPLTKEEIINVSKTAEITKNNYSSKVNYADLVKESKTEKIPLKENIKTNNTTNPINFDQGLMVKSRNKEGQVFKDENKNNISKENESPKENQKTSIMSKLREYAQDINNPKKEEKQKNNNQEDDDLDSDDELAELIKDD